MCLGSYLKWLRRPKVPWHHFLRIILDGFWDLPFRSCISLLSGRAYHPVTLVTHFGLQCFRTRAAAYVIRHVYIHSYMDLGREELQMGYEVQATCLVEVRGFAGQAWSKQARIACFRLLVFVFSFLFSLGGFAARVLVCFSAYQEFLPSFCSRLFQALFRGMAGT